MRRALTQAEIDAAIQEWNGNIESKHAVVRYMKDHAREKDTAAWLRQEYGDDLPALPVTVDGAAGDVPWPKVQRRIVQLIKEDRFYTEAEQDRFDNIDSIAIREALAERGIVNGQVVDPENEKALAKGVCERIGIDGIFNYRTDGGISLKEPVAMPDHKAAVGVLLSMLVDPERGVLKDFSDDTAYIETDGGVVAVAKKDAVYIRLLFRF